VVLPERGEGSYNFARRDLMLLRKAFIVLAALAACLASAQFDAMGMMRKMQTAPIVLLPMPEVKKELKLSGDQNKKIGDINKEFQKKNQELMKGSGGQDLSAAMAMGTKMQEATDEASKQAVAVLDADQAKRLTQIQLQIIGGPCLYEPDMQKTLGLNDQQVGKIDEIKDGESTHMAEIMQQNQRNPKAMQKKMKEARAERDAALLKILTEDQAAKLKDLQGPPSEAAKKVSERFM